MVIGASLTSRLVRSPRELAATLSPTTEPFPPMPSHPILCNRVSLVLAAIGVSLIMIRRDLDELERQGILRKLRGHATVQPSSRFDSSVRYRLRAATAEKEALARAALTEARTGDSVILDESTTALTAARLLPGKSPVTVITNFVLAMDELHGVRDVDPIMLGGEYPPALEAFGGAVCEASLSVIPADIVLTSTSAVSDCFAHHQDGEVMRGKRAMMASAKRRVLLVDQTKFDKVALHRLAHPSDFDLVIVDAKVGDDQPEELRENDMPSKVASP